MDSPHEESIYRTDPSCRALTRHVQIVLVACNGLKSASMPKQDVAKVIQPMQQKTYCYNLKLNML